MDLIPPLGVYAAMLREAGRDLDYPGGAPRVEHRVRLRATARRDLEGVAGERYLSSRAQPPVQRGARVQA